MLERQFDQFSKNRHYNVRSNRNMFSSEYDVVTKTYMEEMHKLMREELKKCDHGEMFGSGLQLGLKYKQFRKVTETVEQSGDEGKNVALSSTGWLVEVETVVLKYSVREGNRSHLEHRE